MSEQKTEVHILSDYVHNIYKKSTINGTDIFNYEQILCPRCYTASKLPNEYNNHEYKCTDCGLTGKLSGNAFIIDV